ncbi:major facilitator superfamily domain-containing protein [Mycena rebaudengoi]|nr:major facilitator superfamily domain-containing protein [Mycena rebaudengoi]
MQFTGRFYLSDLRLPVLPISPFRILFSRPPSTAIGYSASQARYLALILFSFLPLASFIMMGSKSGFYSLFMGYVVSSFGRSVLTASLNVFLSSMPSKPFGYAFGAWGLGAVASPLIFQVTTAGGVPWNYFYYGSLVPAGITVAFLGITFMPTPREFTQDRTNALDQADSIAERFNADTEPQISVPQPITAPVNELRLAFSMRYLWAVALFSLFYCGTETTTQGFIVQYLLAERSADRDTVGYVSSGFWAGISISRIFWSYFSPRISFSTRKYICQASILCAGHEF